MLISRRNKIYFLFSYFLIIIINMLFSLNFVLSSPSVNDALLMNSIPLQVALYLFIILGTRLKKENKNYDINVIVVSLASIIVSFTTVGYLLITGYINGESMYLTEWLFFMVIFWILPLITLSFIGLIVSNINNLTKYLSIILFPILMGPFNYIFLGDNLSKYFGLFKSNPHIPFHPMYGIPVEPFYLHRNILFLSVAILIIMLVKHMVFRNKTCRAISFVFISILVINSSNGISKEQLTVFWGNELESIIVKEPQYYKDIKREEKENSFKLASITGEIDIDTKLEANVKAHFINKTDTTQDTVNFSLYHNFKVKEVKDSSGGKLNFDQRDDVVSVKTKSVKSNESVAIELKYSGVSSPLYPANRNAVFLPSSFPWLPVDQLELSFTTVDELSVHRNTVNNQNKVTYHLDMNINNSKSTFSNLDEKSGLFEGHANGVTLMKSNFSELSIGANRYITSDNWKLDDDDLIFLKNNLNDYTEFINRVLDRPTINVPENIIIMPITFNADLLPQEDVWYFDDHLIVSFPYFFNIQEGEVRNNFGFDDLVVGLNAALTWKYEGVNPQKLNQVIFYDLAFSSYYMSHEKDNDEYIEQIVLNSSGFEKENRALKKIETLIKNKEYDKLSVFFNDLNKKIIELNGNVSWDYIYSNL